MSRPSRFGQEINDLQIHNPKAAAVKTLTEFLSPTRLSPNAQQRRFLDMAETSVVTIRGVPIKIYTWNGQQPSPSVLLSHGFMLNAATMLQFVQPLLVAGFRVITWDHCGHGESGGDWTDMRVWVQSILTIAQLNAPVAGIVSFSLGGTTALMALVQKPTLHCPLLVCINPPTQINTVLSGFLKRHQCSPTIVPFIHQVAAERDILLPEQIRSILSGTHNLPSTHVLFIQDRSDNIASEMEARYLAGAVQHARVDLTQGLKHHGGLSDRQVADMATRFIFQKDHSVEGKLTRL